MKASFQPEYAHSPKPAGTPGMEDSMNMRDLTGLFEYDYVGWVN